MLSKRIAIIDAQDLYAEVYCVAGFHGVAYNGLPIRIKKHNTKRVTDIRTIYKTASEAKLLADMLNQYFSTDAFSPILLIGEADDFCT